MMWAGEDGVAADVMWVDIDVDDVDGLGDLDVDVDEAGDVDDVGDVDGVDVL